MPYLRLCFRLLFFVAYTVWTVVKIRACNLLYGPDMRRSMRIRRRWAARLLYAVGVRAKYFGEAPSETAIIVSNHRSYLDPILKLAKVDAYPVAIAKMAQWMLLGKGAQYAGILYLDRESQGSRSAILRRVLEKLKEGYSIIIYPEGTTSDLPDTLPFQKGVFSLAARYGFPVYPAALVFPDPADFWVRDESFLTHAMRRFGRRRIYAAVYFGPAIHGESPDEISDAARLWINGVLRQNANTSGIFQKEFKQLT